ncbi:MAG: hypothetical protein K1Y36_29650 [Blastocatellia bacterium]|nr:hypothetical protein [Blastocatellia bacterium]
MESIKQKIHSESDSSLLNVNELEYLTYLINLFHIEAPEFDFEAVFVTEAEREIPVERFPTEYFWDGYPTQRTFPKTVITFHLPYSGDGKLLRMKPSRYTMWTDTVYEENACICFEIIAFRNDAAEIKGKADRIFQGIKTQQINVKNEVNAFNASLEEQVRELFLKRKQSLLGKNSLLTALGVPLKKRSDLPATFAIPGPSIRKKIMVRPEVTGCSVKKSCFVVGLILLKNLRF